MGKGGGGQSTSTVTKADPWIGVQPALSTLYGSALQNYNSGGPQYYPHSTLAGSNEQIESALNQGWNTSQNSLSQLNNAQGGLSNTANGISMWENPAFYKLDDIGKGNNLNNNFANPYLKAEADGKYLTEQTNPYLRGIFNDASSAVTNQFKNAIAPGLASQFSTAGRTGSGASANAFDNASATLGRTLSNTANSIYGGAYENERGRQQQALGQLSNNYNSAASNQMSALQSVQQQFGQNKVLQQQAQLAIPGMQQAQQQNLSQLLGIGEYRQGQAQNQINADKARFDFYQNAPSNNLAVLNQLLQGGMSLNGNSSQGTSSGPARNPFQGAAGGAAAGTAIMPGWGTAIGALLGGLGLFD